MDPQLYPANKELACWWVEICPDRGLSPGVGRNTRITWKSQQQWTQEDIKVTYRPSKFWFILNIIYWAFACGFLDLITTVVSDQIVLCCGDSLCITIGSLAAPLTSAPRCQWHPPIVTATKVSGRGKSALVEKPWFTVSRALHVSCLLS